MSYPLPPQERTLRATLRILEVLAAHRYPAILSTKSTMFADEPYLSILADGTFMVQLSLSSLDDRLLKAVDLGAPAASLRLDALRRATAAGVITSVRIQPILPGRETDVEDVILAAAAAGARHIGVEHLKVPMERSWWGRAPLVEALGETALAPFAERRVRSGREWVLPVQDRLPLILRLRESARRAGVSFGAADTDLLWLSDGTCCCSGADTFAGFSEHFRCNYTEAVRKSLAGGPIAISGIRGEWRPAGTIARFINSHSRLPTADGQGAGLWAYLEAGWNGARRVNSPQMFYGVVDTNERDEDGFRIYELSVEAKDLVKRSGILAGDA
jgi:hypothetical protein